MPVLPHGQRPIDYVGLQQSIQPQQPPSIPTKEQIMGRNVPGSVISTSLHGPPDNTSKIQNIRRSIQLLELYISKSSNPHIIKMLQQRITLAKQQITKYQQPVDTHPDLPTLDKYIQQVRSNIQTLKRSTNKEYNVDGRTVSKEQLLEDFYTTVHKLEDYKQNLRRLKELAKKINSIPGAKAYINKQGELVVEKPHNMSANEWEKKQVELAPTDTIYTLTTTVDGKETEENISKEEMLKFLQDRIDTELVAGAYGEMEKQKPFQYWIHTIGYGIQQPFEYGAQAILEATGQSSAKDRYQLQAEYLSRFGKAYQQGVGAVLNPIDGLYAPYLQTFVLMPVAGSAIGGVVGKATGYAMGRAPFIGVATTKAIKAGVVGYTTGQAYNMGISYMKAKTPEEKRATLATGLQFATTMATGIRSVKKGGLKEYQRGKFKQLTGYEKYYPKGYEKGMDVMAKKSWQNIRFEKHKLTTEPQISRKMAFRQKLLSQSGIPMKSGLKYVDTKKFQEMFEAKHFLKNVQTLKGKPKLSKYLKHKLTIKGKKAEQFGSTTWQKDAHDIDIMTKSYWREYPKYQYAAKKFGYDVDDIMDIKIAQKAGEMVSISGTIKQKPYLIGRRKVMRWSEQASRLSGSSLGLAKAGRAKDILRSSEMYEKLWIAKGSPKELAKPLRQYQQAAELVAKDPYIIPKWKSDIVYGPNIKEMAQKAGAKVYTKFGKKHMEAEFKKLYYRKTLKTPTQQQAKSPSFKSSMVKTIPVSTSISKSKSISTSISPSKLKSPSISMSKSISPSSPSKSVSKSISSSSSVSKSISSSISSAPAISITPAIPLRIPKKTKKKPSKGYVVQTKQKGKTYKTHSKVLTKQQAIGYGAELVDKSVDTQFKLKKSSKIPQEQPHHETKWKALRHKYTLNKGIYYEKSAYQKDYNVERGKYVKIKTQKHPKKAKKTFFDIINRGD